MASLLKDDALQLLKIVKLYAAEEKDPLLAVESVFVEELECYLGVERSVRDEYFDY